MTALLRVLVVAALLCATHAVWAHKASDAYLRLQDGTAPALLKLQLSLAIKDIDAVVDLDGDRNGQVTWGELKAQLPAVVAWIGAGVAVGPAGDTTARCELPWTFESLEHRSDGTYLRVGGALSCAGTGGPSPLQATALTIDYRLFRGVDPTHRVIVAGTLAGQDVAGLIAPEHNTALPLAQLAPGSGDAQQVVGSASGGGAGSSATTAWRALQQFVPEGIHHLLTGYDHIAFLLALMLPLRVARRQAAMPGEDRNGLWALVRTVTGFTIGHSVTLALASFGVISVTGRWIEAAIAATIAFSAALNLLPRWRVKTEWLATVFGMVHGLGFATVLLESGLRGSLLAWALAGFNIGVELGQLAVVALWVTLAVALAAWLDDRRHAWMVRVGSGVLLVLSLFWLAQRL